MADEYSFTIYGTRGTHPVCGAKFRRYGGHTTCFAMRAPGGLLMFDAGTGAIQAGRDTPANLPIAVFFTHLHLDHIMGLPAFAPLYQPQARVTFLADGSQRAALRRLTAPPYWPLQLDRLGARINWRELPTSGRLTLFGIRVTWMPVPHPQPCLAYRLDIPGHTIVIATDYEPDAGPIDAQFIQFCRNADCLIFDAQFTPREYPHRRGWGHGTWKHGVHLARAAGVRKLILTHHDPTRSDRQIDAIARAARKAFPGACAARDGLTLRLKTAFEIQETR